MYKSPIEILYGELETKIEKDIMRATQSYGINVDKTELIRALRYDRNQYEKGYEDAKAELVLCKLCAWYREHEGGICVNPKCLKSWSGCPVPPEHFCSYAERRADDEALQ